MGYENNWNDLCQTVRSQAESNALACPDFAAKFQADAAAFCSQAVPQTSPEMQLRNLSFAGIRGVWADRLHGKSSGSAAVP